MHMKLKDKLEIKEAVNSFCIIKGQSKNELATAIGVSGATLSNLDNERWDSLSDSILWRIYNHVRKTDWNIVETNNFETVKFTCLDSQYNHKMIGLIGYTGAGKSTALSEFYRNNKRVFFMTGKKSIRPKRFFHVLLAQMGIMYLGTIGEMVERIAQDFNENPHTLLIIDEAGKLDQTMLMYLHDLRDATQRNSGIILAGVEYFRTNLEKAVEKQKQGMPEFAGRIFAWVTMHRPARNEVKAICEANGLDNKEIIKDLGSVRDFRSLSNQIIGAKMAIDELTN